MTADTPITQFVAAPNGWRAAIADPQERVIMVVPIVAWAPVREESPRTSDQMDLEPVVLFDNVREPIISTLGETLASWDDGSHIHQILAPSFEVREVPDGWQVQEYGD
ncbi:hypothetical protein [Streptomyces sp. NPDC088182]|uniref:hypothetical protein n=1 Tax=Streptomyces sp. NPDC088182 TaxID=3365838 RepID=UPI00380883A5